MEPLDQKEMMVSQEIQALMWVCLCFSSVLEAFFLALDLSFYLSIPFWQSMPKGCELCVWLPWRTLEFCLIVFLSNIRNHTFLLCWWLTLIVCLISFLFLHCKSFTYMFYCSHFSAFALTLAFCSAAVHTWSEQNVCLCVWEGKRERDLGKGMWSDAAVYMLLSGIPGNECRQFRGCVSLYMFVRVYVSEKATTCVRSFVSLPFSSTVNVKHV